MTALLRLFRRRHFCLFCAHVVAFNQDARR